MSRPVDPDALSTDAIDVGTLDAGPVASVGPGGVVTWGSTRLSWWVRAEDRWHQPEVEASERRRRVGGLPIVETSIRVPGGDVTATAFGAVLDGAAPGVVVEVHNSSAVPVAVAFVVESTATLEVGESTVAVTGAGTVSIPRPARDRRRHDDAASLLAALDVPDGGSGSPLANGPGAGALVVPLPHTATARAVVRPRATEVASTPSTAAPSAAASGVATAEQVTSGWGRLLDRAPRLVPPDPAFVRRWTAALCDTVLAAPSAGTPDGLARRATALARCGLLDEADPLVDAVLGSVRRDGALDDADPVGATASLLEMAAALWSGGVDAAAAEQLVGPVAVAAHWLERGRRRPALGVHQPRVAAALAGTVGLLEDLDQPDVARHLVEQAASLVRSAPTGVTVAERGDVADSVVRILDGFAREAGSELRLAAGWDPAWTGSGVEVHAVPTRWGRVSWAVRWHGARPALLWEVEPWSDRPEVPVDRVAVPGLDPVWSGQGGRGEALLAAPAGTDPVVDLTAVPEGGSFA